MYLYVYNICFGETFCLHLQGCRHVPPKRWYLSRSSHGVATQKTNIKLKIRAFCDISP
jgi:hypothetical protein